MTVTVNIWAYPPATFTAPLLSSGTLSNKRADWEWALVYAKVFWEGLQRTYLLSREESGNGLVFEGRHGWESWVTQGWETWSEMGSWVNGWKRGGRGSGFLLCDDRLITYGRWILIQQICKVCHVVTKIKQTYGLGPQNLQIGWRTFSLDWSVNAFNIEEMNNNSGLL